MKKVTLNFHTHKPMKEDGVILAIVKTNKEIDMFVCIIGEYGDLIYPDTYEDIGWIDEDVSLWANLQDVYNSIE